MCFTRQQRFSLKVAPMEQIKNLKRHLKKKQLGESQLRDLTKVDLMVPINLDPIHWRGKRSIGILGHLNVLLKMVGQTIVLAYKVVLLNLSKWL